jgi:hypothetical protein
MGFDGEKLKEGDHFEDLSICRWITLKCVLKE